MGKGDKKTKKGKIAMGSFGVTRPKKSSPINVASTAKAKASIKETVEAKKASSPKKKSEKAEK